MEVEFKSVQIGRDKRYVVIDGESREDESLITANLQENELQITLLKVDSCVLGQDCVRQHRNASSICEYMGAFPLQLNGPELIKKQIPCLHGNRYSFPKINSLRTEACPLRLSNCIDCKFLVQIIIPPKVRPRKSHACIVCGGKNDLPF